MAIQTVAKDGIRTIYIRDDRLVDPGLLSKLFDDIHAEIGKSEEERLILDFCSCELHGFCCTWQIGSIAKEDEGIQS